MASLQRDASDAKSAQQRVETDLAKQQERAAIADAKVAGLEKAASDAKAAQQKVEIDLINARGKLEAERITRLQLQRSVLQRMIPQTAEGDKTNWDGLKPFKGTLIVFLYSPQREPSLFAGGLAPFAVKSGRAMFDRWWIMPANTELADGVTVEAYIGPNGEADASSAAADAFAVFLAKSGIDGVRRSPAKRGELPPNSVRVLIGQMPDPSRQTDK